MTTAEANLGAASKKSSDPIRVMIVDDSAVMRGIVSRWVDEEGGIEIVARHANGELAVNDVANIKPDVVILDIEMPVMDGLTALPLLLKNCPTTKILMASTLTRRNAEVSLKALSLGAIDYVPKPDGNAGITTSTTFRRELIEKVKAVCGKNQYTNAVVHKAPSAFSQPGAAGAAASEFSLRPFSRVLPRILAIGSSTGGPQALVKVMEVIAASVEKIPVVITQHMPPTFTTIFAEHISRVAGRLAKEGEEGEEVVQGGIYVAPGGKHMILKAQGGKTTIHLDEGPEVNFCRPAVDPMFESVSKIYNSAVLSLVLTGMGQDGAVGAGVITDAGGSCIAQDQATSVVWGMPGATANMGNASAVLPLDEIGPKVNKIVKGGV
ncbi:MAG: protein-glutamate methylesterase/protein-glutamine glutaminase [Methyloligellaceae bacterium]